VIFYPEDGSNVIHRNIGKLFLYAASQRRGINTELVHGYL
jgi:hypothetical protein